MTPNIEIVNDEKLILGEGPHWDHEAQALYYIDMLACTVFKYVPSTKTITRVLVDNPEESRVSFVIPVAGTKDKFVIGYGPKLAVLTWDGVSTEPTSVEILVDLDPGTKTAFNDGKADPRGRLWAGTLFSKLEFGDPELRHGTLYSLNAHEKTIEAHVTDVGISNGLTWSSDHTAFYYIDSYNGAIDGFDFNIDSGKLTNRQTVFDLKKNSVEGSPDGMTIDKDDKIWFAAFRGSAVHRIDPKTGSLMQSVEFPAAQITSVAWSGPNLDGLYVTSGNVLETESNHFAGRLYKVTGLGTSGLPGVSAKL